MELGYPDSYPNMSELPFNRGSLDSNFQLSTPDKEPNTEGVWLLLSGTKIILKTGSNGADLPTGKQPIESTRKPLYIGTWQGRPCRMLNLKDPELESTDLSAFSLHDQNPQASLPLLSLAGVGLMIHHWEKSSRYCGYCGEQLIYLTGEWGKKCRACNRQHYPRIHPCVIGLIIKGDELLLVRKPEWADGRFGLVAGFVEFAESLEEAMAREVEEETGLKIGNIRYLGSQSWPFPSQIMNGFVADYISGEIDLVDQELAEAGWFKLDALPTLPPKRSIARYLIDRANDFIST